MPCGPQRQPLVLTDAEIKLTAWSRRPKTARMVADRARIILASSTGAPNLTVAEFVGVTFQTVGKWRRPFLATRLDGLLDAPRPGAPRTLGDGDMERLVRKTLEERRDPVKPQEASHVLAERLGADVVQTIGRTCTFYRENPNLTRKKGARPAWRS